jgi:alcohol dehydrogenase
MGEIAALGPGKTPRDAHGRKLHVGDRVTWSIVASCGECFFCQNDLPQKCERMFKYGHESCRNGRPLSGGLAEYCHLSANTTIVRLPASVPDAVAASANCATATSLASIDAAGGCRDRNVLIHGAGLLGLTAAAFAATQGAASVIVTDIEPARLARARL